MMTVLTLSGSNRRGGRHLSSTRSHVDGGCEVGGDGDPLDVDIVITSLEGRSDDCHCGEQDGDKDGGTHLAS